MKEKKNERCLRSCLSAGAGDSAGRLRRQYGGHFGASDAGGIGKPHCIRREYRV